MVTAGGWIVLILGAGIGVMLITLVIAELARRRK